MALDIFAKYATDGDKENNGTWFPLGGGCELLVARSGNRRYARLLSTLAERHKQALDHKDDAADDLSEDILVETIAKTILLDWKGLSFKGKELPYSINNAKMVLQVRDFRAQVMKFADTFEAFKAQEEQEQGEA